MGKNSTRILKSLGLNDHGGQRSIIPDWIATGAACALIGEKFEGKMFIVGIDEDDDPEYDEVILVRPEYYDEDYAWEDGDYEEEEVYRAYYNELRPWHQ